MARERPHDGEPGEADLEGQRRIEADRTKADRTKADCTKAVEVLEREGLETELMEHDESEAGEDIHHAG